jgi:RNA polymerase sigma-70 factor (sigma-E family)
MHSNRDEDYTAYVSARLQWLRKVAYLLCQDLDRADDLVQTTITKLYVQWKRVSVVENLDGYTRTVLVRVFLAEQRTAWWKRVTLVHSAPETITPATDPDLGIDLRAALAALPPRQRAAVVLRFYCDLSVEHTAKALNCSPGTVKSQTSRGLAFLRSELAPTTLLMENP